MFAVSSKYYLMAFVHGFTHLSFNTRRMVKMLSNGCSSLDQTCLKRTCACRQSCQKRKLVEELESAQSTAARRQPSGIFRRVQKFWWSWWWKKETGGTRPTVSLSFNVRQHAGCRWLGLELTCRRKPRSNAKVPKITTTLASQHQ